MPVGILEPRRSGGETHVPGTVVLLQGDTTKQVTLSPQPSTSPNDPLSWPMKKKLMVLFTITLGCLGSGLQGIALSVATLPVTEELHFTLAQTESLTSYPFLSTAVCCAICAILSRLVGKRPVYLFAGICNLVGVVWSALATSYGSFLAARLVYGLGSGIFESIPISTIGDLFFVHQRGRSTAFYTFLCLGFTQLSPVLGGYITDIYGWRMQFWIMTAYWSIVLLMLFFANPETTYYRSTSLETDMAHESETSLSQQSSSAASAEVDIKNPSLVEETEKPANQEAPQSYLQSLSPFQPIKNRPSLISATLRFFLVGLYPIVWISFLIVSTFQGWWIGTSLSLAQIFGGPPTNFGPTKLGFLNAFGIVGALLAEVVLHTLSDESCKRLAQRNNNTHEPEYRLLMLAPAVLVGLIAFPLFGWYGGTVAAERGGEISWVVAAVLFGLVLLTLITGQSVALSYLLDAHRDLSVEAVPFVIMLRGLWVYGAGTFLPMWFTHSGVADTYYEIAGLQTGLMLIVASAAYVYGKRIRHFMSTHSPLERFSLRR